MRSLFLLERTHIFMLDRRGFIESKTGHSGYPKILGRVIRVVGNSGIENCYPIFAPKKHYPKFQVPDNLGSGSGFTRYTRN
jgi:hypothetical protein